MNTKSLQAACLALAVLLICPTLTSGQELKVSYPSFSSQ
jgi:hypothetical protein